jgi:hypothetical protein
MENENISKDDENNPIASSILDCGRYANETIGQVILVHKYSGFQVVLHVCPGLLDA